MITYRKTKRSTELVACSTTTNALCHVWINTNNQHLAGMIIINHC